MSTAGATVGEAAGRSLAPQLVARRYAQRDFYLRRLLALSDLVAVAGALLATLAVSVGPADLSSAGWALASAPGWVVVFKLYGLYDRDIKRVSHTTLDDVPGLFHALLLGSLLEWSYFQAVGAGKLIFADVLVFAGIAAVLLLAGRACTRGVLRRLISTERVLVIGSGPGLLALVAKMRAEPKYRLEPIGIMSSEADAAAFDLPAVGRLGVDRLRDVVLAHGVGRIVVSDAELAEVQLLEILRECQAVAIKVSMLPAISSAIGPSVEVDDVGGITVLGINPPVLSRTSALLKRSVDIVCSGLLLTLSGPLLLVLGVVVRLDSPGPALFRQPRIGKGGRIFHVLKLRTMVLGAEAQRPALLGRSKDPSWLILDADPRVTRVGRILRRASLDELPQLWNVLKGEMSLVGPRPLIAAEDAKIDGWGRGRLDLTPGITGLWQVLGRTNLPFEEMVRLDYLYVTNWSLWGDIRLMLRTLPAVVGRRGAN